MGYCNNCGCKTSNDICSNCHEELWITEYQGDFIDYDHLSEDFVDKVKEQRRQIRKDKYGRD